MRHTKTPSDRGWYWVANNPEMPDEWQMVYWDAEADEPRLYSFCPEILAVIGMKGHRGVSVWKESGDNWEDTEIPGGWWKGPQVWVGPLSQPGGPFGSTIAEFDQETYEKAKAEGHVMVMRHLDYTMSDRRFGTVTEIAVMPESELSKVPSR